MGESHVVYSWRYKAHRMGQWCNRSIVFSKTPKENLKFLLNCGLWGVCAPLAETSEVRSGSWADLPFHHHWPQHPAPVMSSPAAARACFPLHRLSARPSAGFLGQSLLKLILSSYAKMVAVILWAHRVKKEEKSLFIWSVCFLFLF